MERCAWCMDGGAMQRYHDEEWGVPLHEDRRHFEFLMMEAMQCGLSWSLMIKKREIFRTCFAGFDPQAVAAFDETDVSRIMDTPGMIRSMGKIRAVIHNAQRFLAIAAEFGSFDHYLWSFTQGKTHVYPAHQRGQWVAKNALSDRVSADLRKRGFKYLGSVTVYSHLQACGIVNDHEPRCGRYQELLDQADVVFIGEA